MGIAVAFPGGDFVAEGLLVGDAAVERLLPDILSKIAWLPARITAQARLPGFKPPDDRFYVPAELYRRSLDHRVCSQAPLLDTSDPPGAVAKALGMLQRPLPKHVTAHFDYLRDLWRKQEGIVAPDLERSLAEIHRFFGELSRESGQEAMDIANRYANDECIWDRRRKRFYRPADCFSEPVDFFDPFKVQIAGESLVAAGLDLLGRRKSPDWCDYLDFLRQMAKHRGDESCNPEETKQVRYSLNQLASLMPAEEKVADELFILLTSGKLGIATEVWADDVPHWKGRLDLSSLSIVHDRVPPRLRYLAKQLSEYVSEELDEEPVRSVDKQLEAICSQVSRTIRSREFVAGQRRLVSYEYHGIPNGYESNTARLELIPAVSIQTHFWLDDGATRRQIGGGETKFFLDREAGRIWIGTASSRSARPHLARAINRCSEPFQLTDLSSLEAILFVAPEEIAEILDEREVPRIGADPEEDWGFAVPADTEAETTHDAPEDGDMDWPTESAEGDDAAIGEPIDDGGSERGKHHGVLARSGNGGSAQGDAGLPARVSGSNGVRAEGSAPRQPHNTRGTIARTGTDDAPPTAPGHGNSGRSSVGTTSSMQHSTNRAPRRDGTKGDSRQKGRYSTYVMPAPTTERESKRDAELGESEARGIGAAAVKIVLDFEMQHGRSPTEMPHNNPGYDVISKSPTGEQRYIEVKGVDGTWGELGVAVSHTQFKFAQLRPGDAWLYVVEHARGPLRPVVHPIQAPATKVTQFVFDAGWKSVAKEAADRSSIAPPSPGDEVMIEQGEVVEVAAIESIGDLIRMEVRNVDGSIRKLMWQPGNHSIIRGDDLGEDDPGVA